MAAEWAFKCSKRNKNEATWKVNRTLLRNEGQIGKIVIPQGWKGCPSERGAMATDILREFAPEENDAIKLSFYYRGRRIDATTGSHFVDVLAGPERQLSIQEKEAIGSVLRDASDPEWFELKSLCTIRLKGRSVLLYEGSWKKSGLADMGIFIDADGTGTAVQEIHFVAPEKNYQVCLQTVNQALESIKWKKK